MLGYHSFFNMLPIIFDDYTHHIHYTKHHYFVIIDTIILLIYLMPRLFVTFISYYITDDAAITDTTVYHGYHATLSSLSRATFYFRRRLSLPRRHTPPLPPFAELSLLFYAAMAICRYDVCCLP
jgi:hypothetical protein